MFDNLTVIAIIIIAAWVVTLAFYFYTSRQQREIRQELDELRSLMEERDRPE